MVDKEDRWHRHFLDRALTVAAMSKDPNTQVGCVIVGSYREQRADGFNGFSRGVSDSVERLTDRDLKNRLMVHAERNAICNAARIGVALRGCTLYVVATDGSGSVWGGVPCTACGIEIIQAGITRIVSWPFKDGFSRWRDDLAFSRGILREANIELLEIPHG
jgi:dCMP deaminase